MSAPVYEFRNADNQLSARLHPTGVVDIIDTTDGSLIETFEHYNHMIERYGGERLADDVEYGDKAMIETLEHHLDSVANPVKGAKEPKAPKEPKERKAKAKAQVQDDDGEREVEVEGRLIEVDPSDLLIGKNPRGSDTPEVQQMADSLRLHGQLQNIIVGPANSRGKRMLYAGFRRAEGAKLHNETYPRKAMKLMAVEIPEEQAAVAGLVENLHRVELNAVGQAKGIQRLLDGGMSQRDISKKLGVSQSTIAQLLKILTLPKQTLALVESGKINQSLAITLAKMSDEDRKAALSSIKEQNPGDEGKVDSAKVTQAVREAHQKRKEASKPAKAITQDEADGDEGDNEEPSAETPKYTKRTLREVRELFEDNSAPGADPIVMDFSKVMVRFLNGEIEGPAVVRRLKLYTRADGKLPDNGVVAKKGAK
jgi:ParB/RepB/Spo0J family partition protein